MTQYIYTTTWVKGMNTRPTHSVSNNPNGTVAYNVPTNCIELWEAPADGANVKKNDKWARLDSDVEKWVAVVHLGVTYGTIRPVSESPEEPEDPPVVVPAFPEYFDLTDPQGVTKRYNLAE